MKTFKNCGLALAIAAALLMTTASCSSENDLVETPNVEQPTQPTTDGVKITVSAGIGDSDGTTRAAVDDSQTDANGKPIRTLTFTTGDRLYVTGNLEDAQNNKFTLGCYLTIDDTSISADGKSASFSGDLQVWDKNGEKAFYNFGANPLDECKNAKACLVPKDAPDDLIVLNKNHIVHDLDYTKSIAADVNTLMRTAIKISGGYNGTTKTFNLTGRTAILNCVIGNLSKNKNYTVKLRHADLQSDYESNANVSETTYDGPVTTDGDGIARFAIGTALGPKYFVLQLIPVGGGTTKEHVLGQKTLSAKVYNVTKLYGTCRLTVLVQDANGGDVIPGKCDAITVTQGDKVIYETPSNAMMSFVNGQETITFPMDPIDNATLTITGTRTSPSATYSGIATDVTIQYNQTTNVGPVTMRKGKDLSAGSITATDGDIICQSSSEATNHTITIPNGVTVTLAGVNISAHLAGIICQGTAHIILKGSNSVQGGDDCPAVQAGGSGTTLTISGSGSLTATGGYKGAGIGCGNGITCGDITITGGTVTAKGGSLGAGVGCGYAGKCGNITISGGTGSATKGAGAPYSIGKGECSIFCDDIIIGDTNYGRNGIEDSPFTWSITP